MSKTSTKNVKPNRLSTFSLAVLFCFFFSGLAGLIYQVLWLRMIDKIVGSAPFAVATVLTVFMGGLALGSWLAARYIDRIPSRRNLLSLYGKAELAIGIYGILLPVLIVMVKPMYVLAYNALFDHFWLYRIFTFLGCSILLIIPTAIMGITLPVLCRYYVEDLGHIGARTGRLYGINTIGGAAGAALCGFFLIAGLGVWGSLATAIGINVIIGILCILMGRIERPTASVHVEKEKAAVKSKADGGKKESRHREFVAIDDRMIAALALWIFGISGFCSMAYEVLWTRLLGLMIGPTTYSFSLVVATFIIGLALGNFIFGWLADRAKQAFRLLVIAQACAACLALLVSQFLGNSQFFFSKLIYTFQGDFGERLLVQSIVLFIFLVGPTIFLGATFPLVSRIYARSLPSIGRSIGTAYAVNTVGAILGSFIAGFVLIPLVGKENGLRITAGLQIFTSIFALIYLIIKTGVRIRAAAAGLAALFLGVIMLINFPVWNHSILSMGWYRQSKSYERDFNTTSWLEAVWNGTSKFARYLGNMDVVFYGDGVGGFTTVVERVSPTGITNYTLFNSGKKEANSHTSRLVQALTAHIPLMFHPDPEKVMVLGLASGMTAGETLLYPVKQLDVLEINDQVIRAAGLFAPWNNNCLTNPKTRIILQDGRNHLELTREKYDAIISSPADPWMAGMANLFTLDYFKTVKGRLKGNGIFAQWISAYDMDWDSFAMIGRTFAAVFPDGLLIKTNSSSDLLLLGFSEKKILDPKTADKNIVYAEQSKNITIRDPRVIFNLIVTEDLKGFFGAGPYHTDNRPRLEFEAPKNLDISDDQLEDKIKSKQQLSEETKEIVESNKNIDTSLDNLELMKAASSPPFNDVDLGKASPEQKKRYQDILEYYCSYEDVVEYSVFPDLDIQRECARIQVNRIKGHLDSIPDDSQAYYRLALGLKVLGNTQEEIDALQKTISLTPSYYNTYMELGQVYMSQKRFDEAISQFSEALKVNPGYAEAHNNIGNALALQGKADEAAGYYSRALQLSPDNVDALNNLANVLVSKGKTAEAVEYYTRALKIEPGNTKTRQNLGRIYAEQGRFEDALNQFNEALKVEPGNADLHNYAGLILGQQGEMGAAVVHFMEALRIDPGHFLAHKNLGVTLLRQGDSREAMDHLLKASEIKPDDPEVHRMMGMAFENQGRFKEAAGCYSEVLRLEPDSAENHDNLGVALAQTGQIKEAIEHFNKALEIDSSFEAARDHLKIALSEAKK